MEETAGKAFPMQRVVELYKDEGLELTTEQAEKILELSQKLVNIVVTQYRKELNSTESMSKGHQKVS